MRGRCSVWLLLAWGIAARPSTAAEAPTPAGAPATAEVLAGAPSDLSVTVYRAPDRSSGSINLDNLGGFALVSETRVVRLPAGRNRLRFEGVADGIEAASAIVTGLAAGIIEKNREGALLSPGALLAAAVGKPVVLLRTNSKTGKVERVSGTILSDAGGGVVFETAAGIEGLRCSGLAETFSFASAAHLSATPTLSVLVQSSNPATTTVTLSYLARGFDWAADYVAIVSADGKTMDLGAWVTLANGNGVGLPAAHAQVVAGRVHRESGDVEPMDAGGPILAQCWPRGSTSDPAEFLQIALTSPLGAAQAKNRATALPMAMSADATREIMVTAQRVEQEQLGDLKLYRVPDRTTVASRQSKQVRLLDRMAIPITTVYGADLSTGNAAVSAPADKLLRTKNNAANHLGLPLPSGNVAVFAMRGSERLLVHESGMRDLAVDEEVEIDMGASPDVRVTSVREADSRRAEVSQRIEISNARDAEIQFELKLRLPDGARIVHADRPLGKKNGRPIFLLTIPAHTTATVSYQWQHAG
jgi:hypothetical protein